MQIQCYHCRTVMTVNPQGGQFQCPVCRAVSVVAAPVHPGYYVAPPVQAPHYQGRAPQPQTDNRKAYVLGAFMVLGVVAIALEWWGIVLGAVLLGWGVAGTLGKVKDPMSLVFHDSTKTSALAALSLAFGAFGMTCGAMGIASKSYRAEREAREATQKQEREAVANTEREQREAEAAAARAAHEAELRENVGKATKDFTEGLDAVQALLDEGKWRQAGAKLANAILAVKEYQTLDPAPEGIVAALPRAAKLMKAIAPVLSILVAADQLESNLSEASALTKDTKDGQAWKTAQTKWEAALKNIDTLDAAGAEMQVHVPKGLAAKRSAIEKSLSLAQKIVGKHEAAQAKLEAYQTLCGGSGCVEVTAAQLLKDYADNEARAQSRWGGKRVAVSGTIDSIHLDLFDNPVVSIRGSDRFAFQTVICEPENDADANVLSKGQPIVAIGTIGAEVIGSVALEDCKF